MKKYYIRKNLLPKNFMEGSCLLATLILLPIIFIFELYVVLPSFHQPGTFIYNINWLAAIFILINTYGNLLYCVLIDTSIQHVFLLPPMEYELRCYWHLCERCGLLVPPRSWHCDICNICILKRDHHCIFTSCCVGHYNQRYFFMFITYIWIGGFFAFCYNTVYIWWLHADTYYNIWSLLKMLAPFVTLLVNISWDNCYLILYEINVMSLALAIVLFFYHGRKLLNGSVTFERNNTKYDLGWHNNITNVLGERWYLVWLWPFVRSNLTHDGIYWEKLLYTSSKNR